jgi:hypothetical protein
MDRAHVAARGLACKQGLIAFAARPDDKLPRAGRFCLVKRLSIEEVFAWTQGFVAREWRLLIPVAFAFLALPPLAMDLLVPQAVWDALAHAVQAQNPQAAEGAMRVVFPAMAAVLVVAAFGGLAITGMALLPGISVREALTLALRRLLTMLGALLLVAAGQLGLAMVLAIMLAAAHLVGPASQFLLVGILMGVSLFVTIRLIALSPMIVTRRIGVFSAIRESWLLSGGAFWRILGAVLTYAIGAMVVMIALDYAMGVVIALASQAVGAAELGRALIAVFQRAVAGLLALGLHLLIAAIFRQLNDVPIRGI